MKELNVFVNNLANFKHFQLVYIPMPSEKNCTIPLAKTEK